MDSPHFRELTLGPAGRRFPAGAPQRAAIIDRRVQIEFRDGSVDPLHDWLRDNCPCDDCRIRQTDERRVRPWLAQAAPELVAVEVRDDALHLTWANGHVSHFEERTFADIDRASHRGAHTARMWRAGYELDRFGHDVVLTDTDARRTMFEAFRRDGAVVVTDSPTVPGACMDFVQALGLTLHDSSLGLIFDVQVDPAGFNVAYTAEAISPHNDNAQYTHPPSCQVLAMLVNDATGGESVVVDGWSIIDHLRETDPTALGVLSRVPVGFRQYSATAEGYTRAPLVVLDRDGKPLHLRFSNQLMQPLPFDEPELEEWYRAYRLLGTLVSDPAFHVRFRLCAGDMLFVHGMRVLHARDAFAQDGARHLQDIYFDYDDIIGNLDRMTGMARNEMQVGAAG